MGVDGYALAFKGLPPATHEAIGTQMPVGFIKPAAGRARFQRRLQVRELLAIEASGRQVEGFAEQPIGFGIVLHGGVASDDKQHAARLPFTVDGLTLEDLRVEVARGIEQRLNGLPGRQHVGRVATPHKAEQPAPEGRIEAQLDRQSRVPFTQSLERAAHDARRGQRQHVAGADEAAIAVRAAAAEISLVNDGDLPAIASEKISTGRSDHAAANNYHAAGPPTHPRSPTRNGSFGSSNNVDSAVTKAVPRIRGTT